nr:MAG TPA: hypothetical protein [Caudoviricetes sp.]DAX74405.1 MAG TPA: hypothetical protein [Caudoviricetes sp.]DAX92856.1 MAG TPA: hypothetical protein [Caudoviricetes sp.]
MTLPSNTKTDIILYPFLLTKYIIKRRCSMH